MLVADRASPESLLLLAIVACASSLACWASLASRLAFRSSALRDRSSSSRSDWSGSVLVESGAVPRATRIRKRSSASGPSRLVAQRVSARTAGPFGPSSSSSSGRRSPSSRLLDRISWTRSGCFSSVRSLVHVARSWSGSSHRDPVDVLFVRSVRRQRDSCGSAEVLEGGGCSRCSALGAQSRSRRKGYGSRQQAVGTICGPRGPSGNLSPEHSREGGQQRAPGCRRACSSPSSGSASCRWASSVVIATSARALRSDGYHAEIDAGLSHSAGPTGRPRRLASGNTHEPTEVQEGEVKP